MEKVLLRNIDVPDSHTLAVYSSRGGYRPWEEVVKNIRPEQLIEEIKGLGAEGARRRGISHRHEVELRPERQPKAEIYGL